MIFRQLFDQESHTYTYLLADAVARQAALIDPVDGQLDMYLRLLDDLGLQLSVALDTHIHADHISALGALQTATGCLTMVGIDGEVGCASESLTDGKVIGVGDIEIQALYTPGHTDDSFSFVVNDDSDTYLFSGDTLLIRGTGRTDFQNGNPEQLYDSLHNTLLLLNDTTLVYPAHDYKGWTASTIGEEKRSNPRLQVGTKKDFVELMNNLDIPDPKLMDVAVPANLACGKPAAAL